MKNKFGLKSGKETITSPTTINATIIASGTEITGTMFKVVGSAIIDGKITSDVEIDGDIVIEVNGEIEGNVTANHITCSGDVKGNIFCKEVTHLLQTANVYGDIISTAIKIEEGAVFCGNCKTEARFYADDELKTDQTKTNVKDEASDNKNIKN